MALRTIKFKSFVWNESYKDYDGSSRTRNTQAKQGEEVDLPDAVIAYGESLGAFVTPEDEVAEEAGAVEVGAMDSDELVDWVSESTIPQVVNVAKTDPTLVSALLEAENTATGNDPRTGLVAGLTQVAGDGETPVVPETEGEVDPDTGEPVEAEPTEPETPDAAAERLGVDVTKVEGSGEDDAVTVDDVKEYYDEELANATDGAISLAEDEDVYLADVTGTGESGRISKDDVQKYVDVQKAAAEA